MKKFISTLTILSCFLLAACEDKVYDVSYYTEHLEQAQD
ncbi:EexN family lipoprotein, partial [Escherichia coli]